MPATKGSTPMKPIAGRGERLGDQMLAAAEADLEPDLVDRDGEQCRQAVGGGGVARSSASAG